MGHCFLSKKHRLSSAKKKPVIPSKTEIYWENWLVNRHFPHFCDHPLWKVVPRIPCDTKINQRRFLHTTPTSSPNPPAPDVPSETPRPSPSSPTPPGAAASGARPLSLAPWRRPPASWGLGNNRGGSYGIFGVWWEKWGNNWGFHAENMFFWWERLTKNEMVPMDLIDFRWFFNLNWRFHPTFFCQETWNVIYIYIIIYIYISLSFFSWRFKFNVMDMIW